MSEFVAATGLKLAYTASSATTGSYSCVLWGEWVAIFADRFAGVARSRTLPAQRVRRIGDLFEVFRVGARPGEAQVVYGQPHEQRPNIEFIGESMRPYLLLSGESEHGVTPVVDTPSPRPARLGGSFWGVVRQAFGWRHSASAIGRMRMPIHKDTLARSQS